MLVLLVSLLVAANAEPTYSRNYLRGLKAVEDERLTKIYVEHGTTFIEEAVINEAKHGLTQWEVWTPPCQDWNTINTLVRFDKAVCENIVSGIRTKIAERFPDSEITCVERTRICTISWATDSYKI
jgi:hypothetical protein